MIDTTSPPHVPCQDVCALMSIFGLYFCALGIIDKYCQRKILPGELAKHLQRHHKGLGGAGKTAHYELIANHIIDSHGLSIDEQPSIPHNLELRQEIQGLPEPRESLKCPCCASWIVVHPETGQRGSEKGILTHMRVYHPGAPYPERFMRRHTYRPYGPHKDKAAIVWVFVEGFSPSPSSQPEINHVSVRRNHVETAASAGFLQELYFPQYIKSLKASHKKLKNLVRLPDEAYAESCRGSRKYLEKGLVAIHQSLTIYLKDANTFVNQWHSPIRDAFVFQ